MSRIVELRAGQCIDAFNLAAAGRTDTGMLTLPPGGTASGTVRVIPTVAAEAGIP